MARTTVRMPMRRSEIGMAPRLRQHATAGIDQEDGEIGSGRAGDHVARVLLMARSIGDDELALVGREEAVGDVDGDALLALGGQAVHQQREVERLALRADPFGIALQRGQLIVEDHLAVVEQPPDQGRLAIVDRAAGDEAQQAFLFVLLQVGVDVGAMRSLTWAIRNTPPASSFPCWRPGHGRWRGPGARWSWSAAFPG